MRYLELTLLLLGCGSAPSPVAVEDAAPSDVAPMEDAAVFDDRAAAPDQDAAVISCGKHLTVLFSVGTGAGSLASHASGCWSVVDADGAANKSYRKCSTGGGVVQNPSAPNYAFDDTNPNNPIVQQQAFLQQCSSGATGEGFEYMAYRGSWRLLYPATNLKAFFAELYVGDGDVDDYWPSAYTNNAQLAKHTVYPMINIGPTSDPSPAGKIKSDSVAICKTIRDNGYFGVYVGTWNQPMGATDARIMALADALDACTKP
jgi:hypothetical protein